MPTILTPGASRFKPVGLLKAGRFSTVSLVVDNANGQKRVARWFTQPPGSTEVALLEGLEREARLLKNLSDINVPRFDKVVEGDGGTWLMFQYVEGTNVSHYTGVERIVPDDWLLWWFHQLVYILDALHSQPQPIVIGHIEPSDLVVRGDRLYLCDLGLFEDLFPETAAVRLQLHAFVNFIAPEKRTAVQALPGVDLYSAAAIIFWLATGHAPVVNKPATASQLRTALQTYRPDLPPDIGDLIVEMLDYYPSRRPATAKQVLYRLLPQVLSMKGQVPPLPPPQEAYKFAAESTNPIQAPPPLFEEPEEEPVRVAPRVKAETPAPVKKPPWQEFLEDVGWQARRHAILVGLAGLVLVVAVVLTWQVKQRLAPPPTPPEAVLVVSNGQLTRRVDRSEAAYDGEWKPVTGVAVNMVTVAGPQGATLQFGGSYLWLKPTTSLTCRPKENGVVSVVVEHGHVRVATGPSDSMIMYLASGNRVVVQPSSDLLVEELTAPYTLTCRAGSVSLSVGTDVRRVSQGETLSLGEDGQSGQ